jgi:hypothetical protein
MQHFLSSPFLRRALIADAVMSGCAALVLIAGAGIASGLLGLPEPLLRVAGLLLVPFVALVAFVGARREIATQAVWIIIALNVAWVAASVLLLVSGWVAPTALGYTFVIVQALAVAAFAELQFVGLRRPAMALA